jgi:hypothetical protein
MSGFLGHSCINIASHEDALRFVNANGEAALNEGGGSQQLLRQSSGDKTAGVHESISKSTRYSGTYIGSFRSSPFQRIGSQALAPLALSDHSSSRPEHPCVISRNEWEWETLALLLVSLNWTCHIATISEYYKVRSTH